jgi:DHA1 family bicyclomycin/chloramphenicol resistance-like MFS transporter
MVVTLAFGLPPVASLVLTMFVYQTGMMLAMPSAIAGAVTPYPDCAGAACSLIGFVQQVSAAVVGIGVGLTLGQSAWPLAIAVASMAVLSAIFWISIRSEKAHGDRMVPQPQSITGENL